MASTLRPLAAVVLLLWPCVMAMSTPQAALDKVMQWITLCGGNLNGLCVQETNGIRGLVATSPIEPSVEPSRREIIVVPGALGLSDSEEEFEDIPFAQAVPAAQWKTLQARTILTTRLTTSLTTIRHHNSDHNSHDCYHFPQPLLPPQLLPQPPPELPPEFPSEFSPSTPGRHASRDPYLIRTFRGRILSLALVPAAAPGSSSERAYALRRRRTRLRIRARPQ
mgnify:CR=1 FL=1